MNIKISEIKKSLSSIFGESSVDSASSTYVKKDENSDNLILYFNNISTEEYNVIYTKLMFTVDLNHNQLTEIGFSYLYDINCVYRKVDFSDINDFESKIKNIFKNNKFGRDIKILSQFIKSPAMIINKWFRDNVTENISVVNVDYNPKLNNMSCDNTMFVFDINTNKNIKFTVNIKKNKINNYSINISFGKDNIKLENENLDTLIEDIGNTIKNNI